MEGSGLKHNFRTMHRELNEEILGECKKIFENLHGAETAEVIKKLSAILLQKQVIIASHLYRQFY